MDIFVSANRNRDSVLLTSAKMYAPNREEFFPRSTIMAILSTKRFNGALYSSTFYGDSLASGLRECTARTIKWDGNVLRIGCCSFNARNTAKIARWASN